MTATSNLPARIASRYLPIRLIGKGGMGLVYEVVHAHTGEHLALKVLQGSAGAPAEALERFKREARAPAQIKSDNVVHVSDADVAPELDDAPFLVMELLVGIDLEQAAAQSKPDPATVVGWLRQIAPALDKAHRLGIIHRDLKPENLFLATIEGRPPVVKILDFGIAKMAEEGSAATVSGQVLGTPKYMAPEQAARHPRVSSATDLYALGLIAYRLLVGESYYRGAVMSILAEVVHGTPIPPSARNPSLGRAFDAWFVQACHREPEHRFASASQQVEALAASLGLPAGAVQPEPASGSGPNVDKDPAGSAATTSSRSLLRRRTSRSAIAAGVLLLFAAMAAILFRVSNARRVGPWAAPMTRAPPPADRRAADPPPATASDEVASPPAARPRPGATPRDRPPLPPRGARTPAHPRTITGLPAAPARDPFRDQK